MSGGSKTFRVRNVPHDPIDCEPQIGREWQSAAGSCKKTARDETRGSR